MSTATKEKKPANIWYTYKGLRVNIRQMPSGHFDWDVLTPNGMGLANNEEGVPNEHKARKEAEKTIDNMSV